MIEPIESGAYVTSLEEILWGIGLVALTLGIHGFGMLLVLRIDGRFKARFGHRPSLFFGMSNIIMASWLLVFVHIVEVMMWAVFFQWKQCFPNISTANYFALNEYTTVGSNLHLPLNWRLLEGMISIAGVLAFAWSTGVLLTFARDFQARQLQRVEDQRHALEHPDPDKKAREDVHVG
jgi:predicted MFS family arabinose efflux permease